MGKIVIPKISWRLLLIGAVISARPNLQRPKMLTVRVTPEGAMLRWEKGWGVSVPVYSQNGLEPRLYINSTDWYCHD